MSVMLEVERCKVTLYGPDPSFVPFVAKIQKARTRRGKDYFVMRATIPKEVSEKMNAKVGDYLFFKAKKAEWYHMLDWSEMQNTWKILPAEIKKRVVMDGICNQEQLNLSIFPGATNLSAPTQQIVDIQSIQNGGVQWK